MSTSSLFEPPLSLRDSDLYDAFCNACYSPKPGEAMSALLNWFDGKGVTSKQIFRMRYQAEKNNVPVPVPVPEGPEGPDPNDTESGDSPDSQRTIHLIADSKFKNIGDEAVLKDVANKFGLLIYGKKFNDGVHGAFGQAQNIQSSVKGKRIVLHLPKKYHGQNSNPIHPIEAKVRNSISHCSRNNVVVAIE